MRLEIDNRNFAHLMQIVESCALQDKEKKIVKDLAEKILNQSHGGAGVSGRLSYYLQQINDTCIQFEVGANSQIKIVIDRGLTKLTEIPEVNSRDQVGMTKIAKAIMRGDKEEFANLIQQPNIDLELTDKDGWTPLYRTLVASQNEMFEALIKRGVSLNTKNDIGSRAIHIAADRNNIQALQLLLEKGAKVNVTNVRGSPLLYAVAKENEDSVRLLLQNGANPNLTADSLAPGPLWVAQNKHNDRLVELLESKGAELYPSRDDCSALEKIIKNGSIQDIQNFIGSNFNFEDEHQRSPLIYASWYGRKDVIDLLLENNVKIDYQDSTKKTALHYAVISGHKDIVQALLNAKASVDHREIAGYTPLHWCAQYNDRLEIAKLLVEHNANHQINDNFNWKPFHKCAETGNLPVLRWLLEDMKVPINELHGNGMTALHRAVINKRESVEAYLVQQGIDTTIKDQTGKTAEEYKPKK